MFCCVMWVCVIVVKWLWWLFYSVSVCCRLDRVIVVVSVSVKL